MCLLLSSLPLKAEFFVLTLGNKAPFFVVSSSSPRVFYDVALPAKRVVQVERRRRRRRRRPNIERKKERKKDALKKVRREREWFWRQRNERERNFCIFFFASLKFRVSICDKKFPFFCSSSSLSLSLSLFPTVTEESFRNHPHRTLFCLSSKRLGIKVLLPKRECCAT